MSENAGTPLQREEPLFYAYALTYEIGVQSRFMLTFADRKTAEKWWELVQQRGFGIMQRSNAQLFVLGNLPGEAAEHSARDLGLLWSHLGAPGNLTFRYKWTYSKFSDPDDDDCTHPVIPLQPREPRLTIEPMESAFRGRVELDQAIARTDDNSSPPGANEAMLKVDMPMMCKLLKLLEENRTQVGILVAKVEALRKKMEGP